MKSGASGTPSGYFVGPPGYKLVDSSGEAICPPNSGLLGGPSGHPEVPPGHFGVTLGGKVTSTLANQGLLGRHLATLGVTLWVFSNQMNN